MYGDFINIKLCASIKFIFGNIHGNLRIVSNLLYPGIYIFYSTRCCLLPVELLALFLFGLGSEILSFTKL